MLAPAAVGIYLFGAVRMWSIGPLMILSFTGLFLVAIRPLFNEDLSRWAFSPGTIGWMLFWIYGWLLMPFAEAPYDARIELIKMGSWFFSYLAWTEMARYQKRWKLLLGTMLFLVTMIAWYAIIQHAHGTRMVLNLERPDVYEMRASGTYFCPNHFAALMEIVMPVALCLVFMRAADVPLRLLAGYSLIVLLPVMIITQSRSGWIGAVVGLGVASLLMALRRSNKLFLLMLVVIPLIIGGVGVTLWTVSPMVRTRVAGAMLTSPDPAVQGRFMMWKDSIPAVEGKPALGWGPASFPWVYPRFKNHSMQLFFNFLHNESYQLVMEYGLVGLVLFAGFAVYTLIRYMRLLILAEHDKDAFLIAGLLGGVAGSVAHSMFDYNLHIFSNVHVLVLVAGVVSAGLFSSGDLKLVTVARPWRLCGQGLAIAMTVVLLLASLQVFLSYGLHYLGEGRRNAFDMNGAVRRYELARRVDPGNWRPWLGMAHVRQTQGFWDLDSASKSNLQTQSLAYYEEANRRNPCDMEVVYGMSKAYQALGDQEKALALLRQTTEYEKNHLFYATRLGLQLRRMGRDEEALDVFSRAANYGVANEMAVMNIHLLRDKIAAKNDADGAHQ
ncbi:MAG: hypothetical protein A2X46_08670 [Lentisphaerae bacterium GWF2_57_35]|nr:MAG: hypothetical protein A2X46_08670 [Lentisphaerae bacterium GWF2_57_35]